MSDESLHFLHEKPVHFINNECDKENPTSSISGVPFILFRFRANLELLN